MTKRRRIWMVLSLVLVLMPIALTTAVFVSTRRPAPPLVLTPVAQIEGGSIQGAIEGGVAIYRGVPFAAPAIGDLRWRQPEPVKPWSGVLQATSFKPACMQLGSPIPGMERGPVSEDCLYLNVWTPHPRSTMKLPVMVFLHGGGNVNGSASTRFYWGDQLVRRGVVVVNLSYRVGIFGWLAHPDLTREAGYHASGNYALLDLIAGLRWVRNNISALGGDPNNVTVFGHSAGAFNASRLMASPLAEGLFHKVIGQSGGDFYPAGKRGGDIYLADAERVGEEFVRSMGASSIEELRQMPAEKILEAPIPPSQSWLPIIDGYVAVDDNPTLHRQGKQLKIPLLLGYNALEGANLSASRPADAAQFVAYVQENFADFAPRILERYPAKTNAEALTSFIQLKGEEAINWNVATWARLHSETGQSDVYVYHFEKRPPFGPLRKWGAAHGAELPYVFGFLPRWMRLFTQWPWQARQDLKLTEQIPAYWTNFAKTGNPNADNLPDWPAYNRSHQVMHFANTTVAGPDQQQDQHALMDAYVDSLNQR